MNATTGFPKRIDVQRDKLPPGIMARQSLRCDGIGLRITELGRDHRTVTDIVICIGRHNIQTAHTSADWFRDDFNVKAAFNQSIMRSGCGQVKEIIHVQVIGQIHLRPQGQVNRARLSK